MVDLKLVYAAPDEVRKLIYTTNAIEEFHLLPDDECIIFVRGENPIRDKKWFPWEHEEYLEARKCGVFRPSAQKEVQKRQMEQCQFLNEESALAMEKKQREEEKNVWFMENFDRLTLLDIYASDRIGEVRRNVIRDLLRAEAEEEVIKSIIRPELEEGQVLQKRAMWMEMRGK
jgi:type IV secretion system protein VirD4